MILNNTREIPMPTLMQTMFFTDRHKSSLLVLGFDGIDKTILFQPYGMNPPRSISFPEIEHAIEQAAFVGDILIYIESLNPDADTALNISHRDGREIIMEFRAAPYGTQLVFKGDRNPLAFYQEVVFILSLFLKPASSDPDEMMSIIELMHR